MVARGQTGEYSREKNSVQVRRGQGPVRSSHLERKGSCFEGRGGKIKRKRKKKMPTAAKQGGAPWPKRSRSASVERGASNMFQGGSQLNAKKNH